MSMLSFTDLLRRKESTAQEDTRFDEGGSFENEIEAALELEADDAEDGDTVPSDFAEVEDSEAEQLDAGFEEAAVPEDAGDALTPHAQTILASFGVFEEANTATRDELAKIGKAFTSIVTNYNLGREFVDSCRQEIVRASELEQVNQRLAAENRRLLERTEKQEQARERLDDLLESSKRREARLLQECDTLRINVSDLKLEIIEMRNANTTAEHARTEMHMVLASRTADTERLTREMDVLRERLGSVLTDLDASQKRQTEVRLKLDELQTVHAAELAKFAELSGRIATSDKEALRLQKLCDATESQLKETTLALQSAEHDIWERDRRHQSELKALRMEVSQLTERLQAYSDVSADIEPESYEDDDDTVPVIPLRPRAVKIRPASADSSVTAAE